MRDIVKNQYQQPQRMHQPHRHRRKRNLSLYYLMIFIMVSIVGVILSMTVLFKIKQINVIGSTQYDTKSIIESSKIKIGDNLFRTDTEKAQERILKDLINIDEVNIKRSLPQSISIEVKPSVPYANLQYKDGYLLISKSGKILAASPTPTETVMTLNGYDTIETKVGEKIKCDDANKDKLLKALSDKLNELKITKVNCIDISDSYNIKILYENRITIELGSQNDLEYKLKYSYELIENHIGKNKSGTIFMRGDNEASFVEKSDLEKYEQNYKTATAVTTTAVNSGKNEVTQASGEDRNSEKTSQTANNNIAE